MSVDRVIWSELMFALVTMALLTVELKDVSCSTEVQHCAAHAPQVCTSSTFASGTSTYSFEILCSLERPQRYEDTEWDAVHWRDFGVVTFVEHLLCRTVYASAQQCMSSVEETQWEMEDPFHAHKSYRLVGRFQIRVSSLESARADRKGL
jgi:hypothetical protein